MLPMTASYLVGAEESALFIQGTRTTAAAALRPPSLSLPLLSPRPPEDSLPMAALGSNTSLPDWDSDIAEPGMSELLVGPASGADSGRPDPDREFWGLGACCIGRLRRLCRGALLLGTL